jgi:hypothetical protein
MNTDDQTAEGYDAARESVLRAALRVLSAEREEPHAHSDAESEYADEHLALAARELVRATDALDADEQPVGWIEPQR